MVFNKVFGIGLSRTGTRSLATALNTLGIPTIHCPCDQKTFHELRNGIYDLTVLKRYRGATDTPIAAFFPQYDKVYQNSKFILTVRDKESWLKSTKFHFENLAKLFGHQHFYAFIGYCLYGLHGFNPDRFSYVYDLHTKNVREYFEDRSEDLLILDICGGDGWDKLCPFLSLPRPSCDFPFENAADYKHFGRRSGQSSPT